MSAAVTISEAMFTDAVAAAVRAPSLHNSQPWRFRLDLEQNAIEVRTDRSRALTVADPDGWGMRIACGPATLNLRLAFAVNGNPLDVTWLPSNVDTELQAVLSPASPRPATPVEARLHRAIPRRHSNRRPFSAEPVPLDARTELVKSVKYESA